MTHVIGITRQAWSSGALLIPDDAAAREILIAENNPVSDDVGLKCTVVCLALIAARSCTPIGDFTTVHVAI